MYSCSFKSAFYVSDEFFVGENFVFCQAFMVYTRVSHKGRRLMVDDAATCVKDGLMKGLWVWWVFIFVILFFLFSLVVEFPSFLLNMRKMLPAVAKFLYRFNQCMLLCCFLSELSTSVCPCIITLKRFLEPFAYFVVCIIWRTLIITM